LGEGQDPKGAVEVGRNPGQLPDGLAHSLQDVVNILGIGSLVVGPAKHSLPFQYGSRRAGYSVCSGEVRFGGPVPPEPSGCIHRGQANGDTHDHPGRRPTEKEADEG
jgi:hypothetical protein